MYSREGFVDVHDDSLPMQPPSNKRVRQMRCGHPGADNWAKMVKDSDDDDGDDDDDDEDDDNDNDNGNDNNNANDND